MKQIALEQVRTTNRIAEAGAQNRLDAIRLARDVGLSWAEIGDALGMTRQLAQKRYGAAVGEADADTQRRTRRLEDYANGDDDDPG